MFARTAINYLRQWANKEERKPLVLRGARQVGKTTIYGRIEGKGCPAPLEWSDDIGYGHYAERQELHLI